MSAKDPISQLHGDGLAAPRPEDEGLPSIAEQVERVPTDPGCYLWRDASGKETLIKSFGYEDFKTRLS